MYNISVNSMRAPLVVCGLFQPFPTVIASALKIQYGSSGVLRLLFDLPQPVICKFSLVEVNDGFASYKTHTGKPVLLSEPLIFRIPTMSTYAAEKQVAIAAVRRACSLTASVFNKLVKNETLTKDDKSPVTGRFQSSRGSLLDISYTCIAQSEISPPKLW